MERIMSIQQKCVCTMVIFPMQRLKNVSPFSSVSTVYCFVWLLSCSWAGNLNENCSIEDKIKTLFTLGIKIRFV